MADATIGIVVDPSGAVSGARTVKRSMDDITGSSRTATSAVNMLRSAMASLGLAIGMRQLADWADTWSTIQWRVRNATSSLQEAQATMRRVSEVARTTWTSLDQTADAFLRQEAAMSALGYTTRQQLDHIEALNSALLISGLRGQRAQQVADAWSRAMARGTLRGEEFNSVTQNASRLTQALADHLGVSVVELRRLAEQGKITSDAMYGITDSLTDLRREMEGDATLSGALVILGNSLVEVVGRADGAIRATSSLGNMILWVADNMGRVASYVGTAAAAFVGYRAAVIAADLATKALSTSLAALRMALIRLGIGALVIAAGELVYQFARLVEATGGFGNALNLLRDVALEVWDRIKVGMESLGLEAQAVGYEIQAAFIGAFEAITREVAEATGIGTEAADALAASYKSAQDEAKALRSGANALWTVATMPLESLADLQAAMEEAQEEAERLAVTTGDGTAKEFEKFKASLKGVLDEAFPTIAAMEELAEKQALVSRGVAEGLVSSEMAAEAMERLAEAYEDAIDPLGAVWRELEEERYQLTLSDEQREVHTSLLEIENDLRHAGIRLTRDQRNELEQEIRSLQKQRKAREEATRTQKQQMENFNRIVDDTVRYGSDLFADLFRDTSGGWRDMWENMRQTMISMLARMAAEAALRPIVVSVLGAMGVAGAGAAAGAAGIGGAGGGGGILSSLFGMGQQAASLGGTGGLFAEGGALAGVGSFMSKPLFMVPTGAIEAGTGAMAMAPGISLGGVLGAAGLGFMGGGLIAQLTGGNQMGGSLGGAGGAALGAAIGSAIPGIGTVLGGIAGGLLGGGIGSLFGGGNKDQEIRPISYAPSSGRGRQTPLRGIELDTLRYKGGGAFKDAVQQADEAIAQYLSDRMIEQVRDFLDERGTIRGKKRDNKAIGEKHIGRALREMYYPVIQALGGPEASRAFSSMTSGAKPEKVLETAVEVAAFLGQLHDGTLFKPQEISQLEAAWKALNEQGDAAREMAEKLGQSLQLVEEQFAAAQQAFRDEIQQGYQDQIDAMLRPAELAWRQLREAQTKEIKELEKIGISTDKARQWHQLQIRALFEQNYELQRQYLEGMIDLSEDLNAQVGALWGIVSSGIGGLIADSNAAYQEAVRLGRQYAQINRSLQQTIAGLRTGPQSPLSLEQQLMEALDRFRQTLGEALGGDSEAAQQLQQLVNPVLDLASQFFGRTEGYAQIFDEVLRGLEMAGVAMETQAGGFAALAAALDAQIGILNEINDVLNRRDELGEDFESRYNKLTSELEEVGYTIGGINAFLRDAADAIPTTIVTAFASGLDSAQLAKRMGELFQATVTATEQAMRDGVEDIGAAIHGAQQALLRGWIPDFIELAEQFNGAIPEIRFDRVTARAVAHYEASADQLGEGLTSAVAQVQFDGLQQAIYTAQELVGTRFDAAVGGISFEGIDGTLLAMTLRDGITGIAQAAQVSLNGQAQRIEGVIDSTLEAFTLDATRATILDSVDIINNGATEVRLAFGRVEGALLRLSNNADGHITALIDEVDTAIARFTNWGTGSLRVGVESLRAGLLDVRNAGMGALELWADTVEARETRISNLGPGALAARINNLRGQLVNVRNAGAGLLEFWADTVESRATVIENIDRGNLRAAINDLRGGIVTVRNLSRGHLQFWANRVNADTVRIENIDRGDLRAIVNDLRAGILTIRNRAAGHLEFWSDRVEAGETRIENIDRGDLMAFVTTLRSGLVSVRNLGAGHLRFWANRVVAGETRIENIDRGDLNATIGTLRSALVTIRNLGSGRLEFWAETLKAQETRIDNLGSGTLVAFVNTLRSSLVTIRNAGQGRLEFWADTVEAQETLIENLNAGTLVARINDLRSDLLTIRNAGEGALLFWADTVEAQEARISNLGAGNLVARINDLRAELVTIRNAGQGRLNFWANRVEARRATIENLDEGLLVTRIGNLRSALLTIRNTGQGRLAFWADEVNAQRVRIEDLGAHPILVQINQLRAGLVEIRTLGADRIASWRDAVEGHRAEINGIGIGDINANGNELRARLTNVRNVSQNKLAGWRNVVQARLDQIRDIDAGNIPTNANQLRGALASTRNTAQNRLSSWAKAVQNGLDRIANLSNDLGGGAIAAELKKIVENRLPKRFGEAIDRAFENVFGTDSPTSFLQNMSSLVGANSALVTSLRSLAQTIQMSAENAEQIRRGRVDTYAQGVKGSVQDALGAGVAAGSRTVTDYISNPVYRDGSLAGYDMIKTEKQVRDDSNRRAPLEAALGEIAAHFQQMLGLSDLPKRTLKVDDGTPYFEQLAIAGYGSVATKKLNDMRTMASFMLESYADWAMKGDRVSAGARKLLDGRNWGPGNVQNALANLAKSLGYAGMLPSFASGGYHTGGLAIVGERGPELVDFASPSRIYSAPDTSRIMAGFANDNGSFRELIAEVRALRAENAELRRTVSEGFGDTVQAEGVSGTAIRAEIRGLREDVEELQTATRQQQRRASA